MSLKSRLFRSDDPAHLTPGTVGASVGKVQRALTIVDGAVIATSELRGQVYGPSTTAAVVTYKQARGIINRAYEQTVDNIVGKMTIRSLDDEMSRIELTMRGSPTCGDPGPQGDRARDLTRPRTNAIGAAPNAARVGFTGRITTQINVAFQITTAGQEALGELLADQVFAANELLEEMLIVDSPSLRFPKPFPFTQELESTDDGEIFERQREKPCLCLEASSA